jgi:hypothetical protein
VRVHLLIVCYANEELSIASEGQYRSRGYDLDETLLDPESPLTQSLGRKQPSIDGWCTGGR